MPAVADRAAPHAAAPAAPFEITNAGEVSVASDGAVNLTVFNAEGGRLFRRRAVKASSKPPASEGVLPRLNALAGELLASPGMPPDQVAARLRELADTVVPPAPQHIEWAVAELDGVRAYVQAESAHGSVHVILTRHDLTP